MKITALFLMLLGAASAVPEARPDTDDDSSEVQPSAGECEKIQDEIDSCTDMADQVIQAGEEVIEQAIPVFDNGLGTDDLAINDSLFLFSFSVV